MGKLLSWVVLIALVWLVIRLFAISQRRRERSGDAGASAGASSSAGAASASRSSRAIEGEPIVPCAQCGLFVPASDVVHDDDFDYCSAAHRDAHRAQREAQRGDERR